MIKKYNEFLTENNKYNDILNIAKLKYDDILIIVNKYFSDIDRSKDDLDYYLSFIDDLYKNGGNVYRIIFHYDIKFINMGALGDHWCVTKEEISNFSSALRDEAKEKLYDFIDQNDEYKYTDLKSFMITATIPPKFINLKWSIIQYAALPYELEVNLIANPSDIKIEEI